MSVKRKAALVACSNPLQPGRREIIDLLCRILEKEGLAVEESPYLFDPEGYKLEKEKAEVLNLFFADPDMEFIFDVSGGDLANSVLPYLDFVTIGKSKASFYGYSDLTTVLNAIIAKTGKPVINYQVRNLVRECKEEQRLYFRNRILTGEIASEDLHPKFLRGQQMEGRVLGGNIRCFLKLAGTPYWPCMQGAILLLESLSGGPNQMATALHQYKQLGVFDCVQGVLLGTFTEMEREKLEPSIEELVLGIVPESVPVAKTDLVGHRGEARAVILGENMLLRC